MSTFERLRDAQALYEGLKRIQEVILASLVDSMGVYIDPETGRDYSMREHLLWLFPEAAMYSFEHDTKEAT